MWPFRRRRKNDRNHEMLAAIDRELDEISALEKSLKGKRLSADERYALLTHPPRPYDHECDKCGALSEFVTTYQFMDRTGLNRKQILCPACDPKRASGSRPRPKDVMREILSDLDHLEKGDVTEEELAYVRRSVLGGEA